MKQKLWKELKSRLCPRQNWLKDDACVRCQCCTKEFSFFKRKHHCRFCGKIFCSECSDQYINGNYLGLSQKYVRHCEFCKDQIQKIKKDLNRLTYMVQDEQQIREQEQQESGSSSDEDNCYIYIKHIFGSVEKQFLYRTTENLDTQAKSFNRRLLQRFVEIGCISKEYANSKLLDYIVTGVIQSKMNILPSDLDSKQDYMDLNRFFSIKVIAGQPNESLQLVKGIVLQKNFPLKGMQDHFQNPQVIVIQNSLDEGIVKLKFQELMTNFKSINEFLEEKMMKFNPDVVFVQKAVNRQIMKYCLENGISIVSGFKKKELTKICLIAGIRNRIKSIWNVGKYQNSRFVGALQKIRIKKFHKNQDPLIYLQKNNGIFSLVISERSSQLQSMLKKALHIMIKLIRQIQLEKYLIYTDDEMWEQKENADGLKLHKFSFIYSQTLEKIKPPKLVFYKACLSEKKISQLQQKVYEFCLMKKRYYFFDACGDGTWNQIESYSGQDLTIGHFILIMATNFLKKCSYCGLSHRYRYYFNDKGVQMSAVNKKKRSEVQQIQNQEDLTIEKMRNYLKKYKQAFNIFSYFKCRHCQKVVTKKSKIGKNYLKNSFHYFLMLISSSSDVKKSQAWSNQSTAYLENQQCKHKVIDRYIESSDILFKLQIFRLKTYKLDIIDLKTPEAINVVSNQRVIFIEQLIERQFTQNRYFLDLIQTNINNFINYLDPHKIQSNVSSKISAQFQKLEKLSVLIEKSVSYLDSIQQKEMKRVSSKEINKSSDWTYFLREMAKVEYVSKVALEMLIISEGKLHKYKIKTAQPENSLKLQAQEEIQQHIGGQIQKKQLVVNNNNINKEVKNQQAISKNAADSQDQLLNEGTQETSVVEFRLKKSDQSKSDDKMSMPNDLLSLKKNSHYPPRHHYQLQSNPKIKGFLKKMKARRYQLKKGRFLYYNLLNQKNHFSILAYGLNSPEFYQCIERKNSQSLDSIKLNLIVTKEFSTSWDVKYDIDQLYGQNVQDQTEKRDSYELIAFFHSQFQEIRKSCGISYETYIKSLACSEIWENNSGGKSNSQFAKSKDSLLIIKTVKQQQFVQFQKFAQSYLAHINKKDKQAQDSFLAKIFGIYELSIKGKSFKCVVMQNMFFNIDTSTAKVYDLKGSQINRLSTLALNQKTATGLDTNFKIDKNHQPYLIEQKQYRYLWESLEDDILFLSRNEVIDYSLLVIQKDKDLRLGVIDFMRPYHFFEKIQKTFKQLKYGHKPTVLPPELYASRFLSVFKQYFMPKKSQINYN